MSKRTIALAVIIGGAWLVAAVPRPVAANGSFPMTCTFSDSAKSTKPLVITVHGRRVVDRPCDGQLLLGNEP
jgi:hypothetical protein